MLSEIENYLQRIEDLRGQVGELIPDLPEEALNWRPLERDEDHITNSLAVLAAHVAGAEHFWIGEVVGDYPPTRDRDAEFVTKAESPDRLMAILRNMRSKPADEAPPEGGVPPEGGEGECE